LKSENGASVCNCLFKLARMCTVHDFKVLKDNLADVLPKDISALLDSGYRGVNDYCAFILIAV